MIDFGKGQLLKDALPWLRDDAERKRRILDVVERNSLIEGLPPLDDEMRARFLTEGPQITDHLGSMPAPGE